MKEHKNITDMTYDDISSALTDGGNKSNRDYFDEGPDVDWWESYRHELKRGLFYDVHTHGSHKEGCVNSVTLDTSCHRQQDKDGVDIETAMADPGHAQHLLAKSILMSMGMDVSKMVDDGKVDNLAKRMYMVDGKTLHNAGVDIDPSTEILSFVTVNEIDGRINDGYYEFDEDELSSIRGCIGGCNIGLSCEDILAMLDDSGIVFED